MSDPVTNVEIEDVLSSIRRLVSSDAASDAAQDAGKGAADGTGAQVSSDASTGSAPKRSEPKLVLTPAQRIKDAPRASANDDAAMDDADETAFNAGGAEDAVEEAVVDDFSEAETEASDPDLAAATTDEETSLDLSEDPSDEADTGDGDEAERVADTALIIDPDADSAEAIEDQTVRDTDHDTEVAQATPEHHDSSERDEDALLQLVAEQVAEKVQSDAIDEVNQTLGTPLDADEHDADAESAALTDDVSFDDMPEPDVPEFLRRPITQMNPPQDAEEVSDPHADDLDTAEADTTKPDTVDRSLAAKLESLEAAVIDQTGEWEPDGGDEERLAEDTIEPLPWNDIEAEMAEIPDAPEHTDPYVEAEAAQTPPWFGDDAVLDEDALRDMVGEIVRQELQGALGERITRNVRKLVRREIHRALMSQGLD